MIAPAVPASPDIRVLFEQQFLPEITRRSRMHFGHLSPDAREEAIQDSV